MARLVVHVTPRSGKLEVVGWREDGALGVRVKAPPEGGKANGEVERLVAEELGVPKSAVRVVRGASSKHKELRIEGIEQGMVDSTLGRPSEG